MPYRNSLIGALSQQDAATLKPYLHFVNLTDKRILYDPGDEITNVYFPITAVISLVAVLSTGEMIEAAMVGRDGVVGAAAALNGKIALSRTVVQLPGDAFACSVEALAHVAFLSRPLLSLLIRHEQTVYAQRSSRPHAWQLTTFRNGSAVGFYGHETWRVVTRCRSRRSFWPRCWEFAERV